MENNCAVFKRWGSRLAAGVKMRVIAGDLRVILKRELPTLKRNARAAFG